MTLEALSLFELVATKTALETLNVCFEDNVQPQVSTRLGCFYVTGILSWGYGLSWAEAIIGLRLILVMFIDG